MTNSMTCFSTSAQTVLHNRHLGAAFDKDKWLKAMDLKQACKYWAEKQHALQAPAKRLCSKQFFHQLTQSSLTVEMTELVSNKIKMAFFTAEVGRAVTSCSPRGDCLPHFRLNMN